MNDNKDINRANFEIGPKAQLAPGNNVTMRIDVLTLNGVFDTGLSGVLDALTTSNDLARRGGLAKAPFDIKLVGLSSSVRSNQGFTVPVAQATETTDADWVIVPAIGDRAPEPLATTLARPDTQEAAGLLKGWFGQGAQVAAACVGTFIAAESGVLDGESATTTWWLAPFFRLRYPHVRLDDRSMLVRSGRVLTAGAALSHMDMALWLIRQTSPVLADVTARYLIVDSRASQSAYAMSDHLAHSDPIVHRFEQWARENLGERFSLHKAADATGVSKRTLTRLVRSVLGRSPLSYVQDLRVEHAVHLLRTSRDSVESVAFAVGYADGVTLRNLIRRKTGLGLRDIRPGVVA